MSTSLMGAAQLLESSVTSRRLGWVADALGLSVELDADAQLAAFEELAELALRRNPRRAHLLVSRVLGKHLPVDPDAALAAGARLGERVGAELAELGMSEGALRASSEEPLVFGFAETATALGHAVAAALPGARCVLSTRRPGRAAITFDEEHSHAVAHRVLAPAEILAAPGPVVLVDDELSSGRTAVNTIRALHARFPHRCYVVATLLDMRPASARAGFGALSAELGVPVRVVSLLSGALSVPGDAPTRVSGLVAGSLPPQRLSPDWPVERVSAGWPVHVRLGGRYGWRPADETELRSRIGDLADVLAPGLASSGRVLVLGTEELMYAPMLLASALADRLAAQVRYQSTTRSPVAPIDRDGYAVRCALAFRAPDAAVEGDGAHPDRMSYVYNVRPGVADAILVVTDGGDTAALTAALRGCAPVTEVLLRDEVGAAAGGVA